MDLFRAVASFFLFGGMGLLSGSSPSLPRFRLWLLTGMIVVVTVFSVLSGQLNVLLITLPWIAGTLVGLLVRRWRERAATK